VGEERRLISRLTRIFIDLMYIYIYMFWFYTYWSLSPSVMSES